MRKIVLFLHTSLDSFVQGTTPWDLGWVSYDEELERYGAEVLSTASAVLFRRVTYQGMEGYWRAVPSNPKSSEHERQHAQWLENTEKIVFSRTISQTDWNKTRFISRDIGGELAELKREGDGDIVMIGSPGAAQTLMQRGLIDEYRFSVSPVVLGEGKALFQDVPGRVPLPLVDARTFASGALGLTYRKPEGP